VRGRKLWVWEGCWPPNQFLKTSEASEGPKVPEVLP
jgi:hypothetical protein